MIHSTAMAPASIPLIQSRITAEALHVVDPGAVHSWDEELAGLSGVSFFHGSAWARVLVETYGHKPLYLRANESGGITGLLPLMEVSSPLTGKRGVALPFTDCSQVLATDETSAHILLERALQLGRERGWRYLELREIPRTLGRLATSVSFLAHELDLRLGPDALLKGMDDSAQRAVRKAEKAGMQIGINRSPESMQLYFRLHCLTRQRHGLPPQPLRFFENIGRFVLGEGHGFVAIARWMGQPVAAAVFVHSDRQVVYKYGASDETFQAMRPNNLLFAQVIRECCAKGFETLHFGRTSLANEGLCRFKRSLGAVESPLRYARYHFGRESWITSTDRSEGAINAFFRCLPVGVLRGLGRLLYRHLA